MYKEASTLELIIFKVFSNNFKYLALKKYRDINAYNTYFKSYSFKEFF